MYDVQNASDTTVTWECATNTLKMNSHAVTFRGDDIDTPSGTYSCRFVLVHVRSLSSYLEEDVLLFERQFVLGVSGVTGEQLQVDLQLVKPLI